jgi:hypothetical protein
LRGGFGILDLALERDDGLLRLELVLGDLGFRGRQVIGHGRRGGLRWGSPDGVGDEEQHGQAQQEVGEEPASQRNHVPSATPAALVRLHD